MRINITWSPELSLHWLDHLSEAIVASMLSANSFLFKSVRDVTMLESDTPCVPKKLNVRSWFRAIVAIAKVSDTIHL